MITLGVDCGTSSLKAALVGEDGATIASAASAYRPDAPRPHWSEQDPEVWVAAMFAALGDLRRQAPQAFGAAGAIGFSGQMHGAVLIDRAGRALRPAMLHNDGRAHREARELWERHRALADVVGVKPMPGFTGPKLLWVKRNEPEVFAALDCVLQTKDYLRLRLTGARGADMSDAAGAWWLDEAARHWSHEALAACGVDPAQVPALTEACDPVGTLLPTVADELGLPRSTLVAAGGGDAAVGAVGIGAVRPGDAFISLGTATQLVVVSDAYRAAPDRLVHSFAHALPGRWYRMAAMLNGAGALAFVARLVGIEVATLEAEAASDYRGPGETIALPYLSGERTPHDDPYARAVFFGLGESASRVDLARAMMEGVALTLAEARDCLAATGDVVTRVDLIGGGARSALWTRMIAAALNCEVIRRVGAEVGPALGAARLARLAASGEAPEAVCLAPPVADVTRPEPRLVEAFAAARERFGDLYRTLKPEFAKSAAGR
ncbi:MAG: xylulokinase [Bradyrhizobium sp.]|nr:MAG: xylulokinase [Bradyrhizobium sp.]